MTAACLLPSPAPSAWSSPVGKGPRETLAWLSFLLLHNQPLLWPRQPLPQDLPQPALSCGPASCHRGLEVPWIPGSWPCACTWHGSNCTSESSDSDRLTWEPCLQTGSPGCRAGGHSAAQGRLGRAGGSSHTVDRPLPSGSSSAPPSLPLNLRAPVLSLCVVCVSVPTCVSLSLVSAHRNGHSPSRKCSHLCKPPVL